MKRTLSLDPASGLTFLGILAGLGLLISGILMEEARVLAIPAMLLLLPAMIRGMR